MGGGIAQVAAAAGCRVSLHDAAPGATERALETMRKSLAKLAEKGGADPDEVLGAIEVVDDLVPADLMIEAVVEDATVKEEIFCQADSVLPVEAVLASNTSSIPITSLAADDRPARPRDRHALLQPVPVLKLVEVVRGRDTSDETVEAIVAFAEELGKVPALGERLAGLRLEPDPDAVHQRGRLGAARRRRRGGGDRHDRQARLRPPDGPARARRPDRARHVRRDHGGAARRASATRSTRRARCSASTSRPGASAGSPATASTVTRSGLRAHRRPAGDPGAHARVRAGRDRAARGRVGPRAPLPARAVSASSPSSGSWASASRRSTAAPARTSSPTSSCSRSCRAPTRASG